jgi:hypothetical protein
MNGRVLYPLAAIIYLHVLLQPFWTSHCGLAANGGHPGIRAARRSLVGYCRSLYIVNRSPPLASCHDLASPGAGPLRQRVPAIDEGRRRAVLFSSGEGGSPDTDHTKSAQERAVVDTGVASATAIGP